MQGSQLPHVYVCIRDRIFGVERGQPLLLDTLRRTRELVSFIPAIQIFFSSSAGVLCQLLCCEYAPSLREVHGKDNETVLRQESLDVSLKGPTFALQPDLDTARARF